MAHSKRTAAQELGQRGENLAVAYLEGHKFKILARNWRPAGSTQRLELDIVAREKQSLVFVEVKTRQAEELEYLTDNFTAAKQKNFLRAAQAYLRETASWHLPCRFDLICIKWDKEQRHYLEHLQNVIELRPNHGHLVGGGDAAWQPW